MEQAKAFVERARGIDVRIKVLEETRRQNRQAAKHGESGRLLLQIVDDEIARLQNIKATVAATIAKLPYPGADLLRLYYIEGKTKEQTAEAAHYCYAYAWQLTNKAIENLQALLSREGTQEQ